MRAEGKTTREKFADAFFELSEECPVNKISVKMITEKSGISRQTFYNLFKDKNDLMFWMHKTEGDRVLVKLENENYTFEETVNDNIAFFKKNKDFILNMIKNTYGKDSYVRYAAQNAYKVWEQYIIKKFGKRAFTKEIKFYLNMYCHAYVIMVAESLFEEIEISEKDLKKYVIKGMPNELQKYLLQ